MVTPFGLRVKLLGSTRLFLSIGMAAVSAAWAVYIYGLTGSEAKTGIVSGLINLAVIVVSLLLVRFMQGQRSKLLLILALSSIAFAYMVFGITASWMWFIIATMFLVLGGSLRMHSFGELTKHQGSKKQLFFLEGVMYLIANVGWLIGPIIASLAMRKDTGLVFVIAGLLMAVAAIVTQRSPLIDAPGGKERHRLWPTIKAYVKQRSLRKAYLFNLGLNIWWVAIFTFMPLFIINQGLPKSLIGIVLFANMIPVLIMETLISRYGKRFGERFFFLLGFGILAACGLAIFFINDPAWVLSLIVVSGVGAGAIEPTQEAYFFRKAKAKDEKRFFTVFLSSGDVGAMLAKFFGAALVALFPFKASFLGFGVIMLALAFLARKK